MLRFLITSRRSEYRPCWRLALVAALSFLPRAVLSQTAAQQSIPTGSQVIHVESNIVLLDVVVTDRKGNLVNGLGKDDFQVFEDKTPEKILSFEAPAAHIASTTNVALPPLISSTADLDRLTPQAPVAIIVLDEVNTQFVDEAFARYSLGKYLDAQGDTLRQPTMLAAVDMHQFMVLRDYTTKRNDILSALNHHLAEFPWQLNNTNRQPDQLSRAFSALQMVAEATTGHIGHKSLIWVGRGMPFIDLNSIQPSALDQVMTAIRECTNKLQAARITLYAIDPAGLSADPPAEDDDGNLLDDPFGATLAFDNMVIATGGRAYHGRNDIDSLLEASVQEGSDFYTLSYAPSSASPSENTYRNIRIVLRNPALRANTRKGYYTAASVVEPEPTSNTKLPNDLVFDLTAASRSLLVYDAVPMNVVRDAINPDKFHINIRAADAAWQSDKPEHLHSDVLVIAESFDRKGKMLQRNANVYNFDLSPDSKGNSPVPNDISISESISTTGPAARLRFVVRNGHNGKLGAQNYYLVDKHTITDSVTGLNPKDTTH